MNNIYNLIIIFLLFGFAQQSYAQKSLRIRISETYKNGVTDCDGNDDEKEWLFNTVNGNVCVERDGDVVTMTDARDITLFGTNTIIL